MQNWRIQPYEELKPRLSWNGMLKLQYLSQYLTPPAPLGGQVTVGRHMKATFTSTNDL